MTSTDHLKMMFVEEFEKAFGKPKADGVREAIMISELILTVGKDEEEMAERAAREWFNRLAIDLKKMSPNADVEFHSLVVLPYVNPLLPELVDPSKRSIVIDYLVDPATGKIVRYLYDLTH